MNKKKLFSLHVNMDDFIPATDEEKAYIVQMRPSTTFFKDGVKRLCKNKVALGDKLDGTPLARIGSNIISLFIVFAVLYWVSMARLIRGQILSLREQEYVLAAQATGAKGGWIITRHLVPNCMSVIFISTALQIPNAIFTESFLSYLGLGVNAPMPSLGSLASDALNGITSYPYRMVIPALIISLIVLSLNLFGDGLRDAFDPKLNG